MAVADIEQLVPIMIYKGNLGPPIEDIIRKEDGQRYNLQGQTVTFMMRPEDGDTPVVSRSATVDPDQNNNRGRVTFTWQSPETDVPGEYRFWWRINTASGPQDVAEYPLVIAEHAAGFDKRTGRIAELLAFKLPASVHALRRYQPFGDEGLQTTIDLVKYRLFNSVPPAYLEATLYNPRVADYIATVSALRIIPVAVDYWGDQTISVSTSGTNESATYPERRDQLWKIYNQLKGEVEGKVVVEEDGAIVVRNGSRVTGVPTSRVQPWVTPDPAGYPRLFATPNTALPWATTW